MNHRSVRHALLAAAVAATGLAGPAALATASAAPIGDTAILRGAHFSPDTPGVDVYLTALSGGTSRLWLSGVGYGDVSPYGRLSPGLYAVSMRPHGASASTPAALSWTLNAKAGQAYTAAAVGMNKQLHGIVLRDELTPPASGHGLVRVIQAASRAPRARVSAKSGPVVAASAQFATSTQYTDVPAGTWSVQATAVGSPALSTTASVTIASGSVISIVVLDGKGAGITIRSVVDAAGAVVTPIGSVPAGGGGTATGQAASWRNTAAALTGLALALMAAAVLSRRRAFLRT